MTFAEISPVLVALLNTIGLVAVAVLQYRQMILSKQNLAIAKENHLATNSMKDELVTVTKAAALAQGKEEERLAGGAIRDAEARGRAEIRETTKQDAELEKVVDEAVNGPTEEQAKAVADTAESTLKTVEAASDAVDASVEAVNALKRKT